MRMTKLCDARPMLLRTGVSVCVAALLAVQAQAEDRTIAVAALVEPPSLDSANAYNANSRTVMGNVYEGLVGRDGRTNAFVPELAVSWTQIDDRTWQFTLREDVLFHDGSPLTAEGAAAALSHVWSKDNGFQIRALGGPEMTFEAKGDMLLEVRSDAADPLLLTRMWQTYIPSAEHIRAHPEEWGQVAVGTGPYKVRDWTRGTSITLEANPDWWGQEAEDAYGRIQYAEAVFEFRPEASSRIAALQAGEVDFAERLPGELCKSMLGENCIESPDTTSTYFRLDSSNPVLADPRIRKAISLAVDRQTIGDVLLGGAQPATMIVGPSATGYNADLPPLAYDVDEARRLVEEAKADGVPVEDTPLWMATMQGGFIGNADVMEVMLEQLKQIGIPNVKVEVLERGPAWQDVFIHAEKPIDPARGLIALHKHTNDPYDFASTAGAFYTCEGRLSVACNPEIDEKLAAAVALTGDARQAALAEIGRLTYEDLWYIPLHHEVRFHGVSDSVAFEPPLHAGVRLTDIIAK
ncbi:ABC transporter substrate-binding protein [Halovulum sp. GXIMD14794]